MNTTQKAVEQAIKDGYTAIETFAGPLSLNDWLELTSLTNVHYEAGRIVTDWLPSILEKGKLERCVFTLL